MTFLGPLGKSDMDYIYQLVDFINVQFLRCENSIVFPAPRRYVGKFSKDQVSHLQLIHKWFSK